MGEPYLTKSGGKAERASPAIQSQSGSMPRPDLPTELEFLCATSHVALRTRHINQFANNNPTPLLKMKYIFSQEQLVIPDDVKIHIRSRIVSVEGPRGTKPSDTFSNPQSACTDGTKSVG